MNTHLNGGNSDGAGGQIDEVTSARRAPRVAVPDGVYVEIDFEPSLLRDFSMRGMQVLTIQRMRPDQRVRVLLPTTAAPLMARVVRSEFEGSSRSGVGRFRVGLEFEEAEQCRATLEGFQADYLTPAGAR